MKIFIILICLVFISCTSDEIKVDEGKKRNVVVSTSNSSDSAYIVSDVLLKKNKMQLN